MKGKPPPTADASPVKFIGTGVHDRLEPPFKFIGIRTKMWPLAAIVFVASILVPMLKMVFLGYLLISVRVRSRWRLKDRTLIYRIVEAVGRWSMVDVFVVSILVALVQLGSIADITPNVGILAFASVISLCAYFE